MSEIERSPLRKKCSKCLIEIGACTDHVMINGLNHCLKCHIAELEKSIISACERVMQETEYKPVNCSEMADVIIKQGKEIKLLYGNLNFLQDRNDELDDKLTESKSVIQVLSGQIDVLSESLKNEREQLGAIRLALEDAPELNISNYHHDEVAALNDAFIEIDKILPPVSEGEENAK